MAADTRSQGAAPGPEASGSTPAAPTPAPGATTDTAETSGGAWRLTWKLAVSIILLIILVRTQDLGGVLSLTASADPGWLAAATLVMLIEQSLTAVSWAILLQGRGLQVGYGAALHIHYLSSFIGTWLPSSTGPDVVRAYYLARQIDTWDAVASMLVLRFVSLLGLGLFALGGILLVPADIPDAAVVLALLLVAGSAGALLVGLTQRPRRWMTGILGAVGLGSLGGALGGVLGKLHDALHAYRAAPGALAGATLLSLVVQFLRILTIYYAALALGATVPLAPYIVLVPVTILITLLPISLAGLGVREGAFVYFFGRVGMPEATAFGLGLLVFGLTLVLWVIGAVLYWARRE